MTDYLQFKMSKSYPMIRIIPISFVLSASKLVGMSYDEDNHFKRLKS